MGGGGEFHVRSIVNRVHHFARRQRGTEMVGDALGSAGRHRREKRVVVCADAEVIGRGEERGGICLSVGDVCDRDRTRASQGLWHVARQDFGEDHLFAFDGGEWLEAFDKVTPGRRVYCALGQGEGLRSGKSAGGNRAKDDGAGDELADHADDAFGIVGAVWVADDGAVFVGAHLALVNHPFGRGKVAKTAHKGFGRDAFQRQKFVVDEHGLVFGETHLFHTPFRPFPRASSTPDDAVAVYSTCQGARRLCAEMWFESPRRPAPKRSEPNRRSRTRKDSARQ